MERTKARALRARVWRARAFVVMLLALAIALRVYNLTAQSFWADEGNSVRVTERPLNLVIDAARADVHPPGYYLLLWGWARLFGQSETSMRALSVCIGVALVGLVYLLGRAAVGPRAAWLAAFCAAISPFQVAYSQEVRMYILVAFLGTGATYAFVRWTEGARVVEKRRPRRRGGSLQRLLWSAVYVVAVAAGLWTHYSFPIAIVALNVAWLAWWLRRRGEPGQGEAMLWWLGMHLAAGVLYLPWLPTAWAKIFGYGPISTGHDVPYIVAQSLKLLSVGETVPDDDLTRWLTVGIVGLSIFGAWGGLAPQGGKRQDPSQRRSSVIYTLALISLVLAPMAMMIVLTLSGRPAYRPKFTLIASPAFCLLVGQGIALLEGTPGQQRTMANRLWLLLGMGIVAVGAVRSLRNYYGDPAYARSDYRAMAASIAALEREGDAILLNAPNQWEVFTYYYRGRAPVYPLCRSRPPDEASVVAELEGIAAQHKRLFALYWATDESDPQRIVERWLQEHAFKASDAWYGDVRLVTYAVPVSTEAAEMAHPLEDVRLGTSIALRGYTLTPSEVQGGDILQVMLFWEALEVPATRYKVFVHLVDDRQQIVAQYDGEPGDGMNLTTNWRPEQGTFPDRYGIWVPHALASGEYGLWVGMYDVSGAPRLPTAVNGQLAGDALLLETVEIR